MPLIAELIKDRRVYSIPANATVLEAARLMMEHNIGAVPVMRDEQLVGIFSERDIQNRVVALGRQPGTTEVSEVMTSNPKTVSADETVEDCLFLMREFGFRHVLVTDGKAVKGLVSLRDILLRYLSQKDAAERRAS
jgi:CBS domain-containing protein